MTSEALFYANQFLEDVASIAHATDRGQVAAVAAILYDAWSSGRCIYVCGNGGSASTAAHLACDLAKFTRVDGAEPMRVLSLCDNAPLISALTNDWGFDSIFVEQIRPHIRAKDVLIVISVHGAAGADRSGAWSQNLVRAAELATERGAKVVALVGFDGGVLHKIADASILVPAPSGRPATTPLVEGFHVVLHHLLCAYLRDRIADSMDAEHG